MSYEPCNPNNFYGGQNTGDFNAAQAVPSFVGVPHDSRDNNITSIDTLKMYAQGVIVRLPDFAENQPLIARIKRPSLLALSKSGKIPNELLTTAGKLFNEGSTGLDSDDENTLKKMYELMEVIAKSSLVSPTFDQIVEAGLELTDEQLMAIFNYSQSGIKALEPFRQ